LAKYCDIILDIIHLLSLHSSARPALSPLLQPLFELTFNPSAHDSLRYMAYNLIAQIILNTPNRAVQLNSLRFPQFQLSALGYLLCNIYDRPNSAILALSLHILRVFFSGNAQNQLQCVISFTPSPESAAEKLHFGPVILQALSRNRINPYGGANSAEIKPNSDVNSPNSLFSHSERCKTYSFRLLDYLLWDNNDCQLMLLSLPLSFPQVSHRITMVDCFLGIFLAENPENSPISTLLALQMSNWLFQCVDSVELLFSRPNFAEKIVHWAKSSGNSQIRAVSTYIIAICLQLYAKIAENGPNSSENEGKFLVASNLIKIIQQELGLDKFKANLAALRSDSAFITANSANSLQLESPALQFGLISAENYREKGENGSKNNGDHCFAYLPGSLPANSAEIPVNLFDSHFTSQFLAIFEALDRLLFALFTPSGANFLWSNLSQNGLAEENKRLKAELESVTAQLESNRRQLNAITAAQAQQTGKFGQEMGQFSPNSNNVNSGVDIASLRISSLEQSWRVSAVAIWR
jgi:hypothetical protein